MEVRKLQEDDRIHHLMEELVVLDKVELVEVHMDVVVEADFTEVRVVLDIHIQIAVQELL